MATASVPVAVALAAVGSAVVWVAGGRLETASERLGAYYGFPPVVQGAVIAAVGSSFPELTTAVLSAALHDSGNLGVGAIVGSAIFNILVIPGWSALRGRGMEADRDVVYKETQFYMLAVAVFLITLSFGVIYLGSADGGLTATLTRPLALVPLALYGVYVFIQHQDVTDYDAPDPGPVDAGRQWLLLAGSLVVIVAGVEALVQAALSLETALGVPSTVWGLTVVAAGTSLPDAAVSVRAAKAGRGTTSLANVLGSNTFDLLVAVPAAVLVAGYVEVDFGTAVPMLAFLTVATLAFLVVTRTHLELTRSEAAGLLALYAVFVGWMATEATGVTGFVPGI
ncbi:sodium:calcium antiporter [Candidatus Halobonum tyrrellensis]|uniref:Na+/Ca2+-exchanging protein n=1 Tax=Candidatus Halobonum tyrrellensis G22 TaxID=1324957 RepID=V4HEL7_9EURY|nr:sodium:calcium antiporter [Candidatus Halobonum tyrrellensis]ESP89155.1 Na+/Ca2+-exchanging protein [Candidatus Halobonum tyrrellensis G22]